MLDFQLPDLDAMKTSLFTDYVTIASVVGVIVFVILLFICWKYKLLQEGFTSADAGGSASASSSSSSSSNKTLEIYFFYTDWCPHCKTAKPEWESVKSEMDGTQVNGYTVKLVDVNCSQETPEVDQLMKTFSVEGYPSIKALKDGTIIDYDAKPSKETLTQFINSL